MHDERFERAVALIERWGRARPGPGGALRTLLSFGGVSLWDAVAPYLALYRVPHLLSAAAHPPSRAGKLRGWLRPYRGLAGRLRDAVVDRQPRDTAGCDRWPVEGPVALFLGFSPLFYRDVLATVAEELSSRGRLAVEAIGDAPSPAAAAGEARGVAVRSFRGHWGDDVRSRAKETAATLRHVRRAVVRSRQMAEAVRNEDGPGWASVRRELDWLFYRDFTRLAPILAVAEHVMERHRPSMIVTADDADQRSRVLTLLARQRGVPTLAVQQGFAWGGYPEWRYLSADAVAAMGPTSRDLLVGQGVSPDRITVTGNPGFDRLTAQDPEAAAGTRFSLGVDPGETMVLFASQPYVVGSWSGPEARREMIEAIRDEVTALEGVRLVVKPHPTDDVGELRALMGGGRGVVFAERRSDIADLIKSCDVLVTFFSTSALQALIAGRPVVTVAFPGSGTPTLYSDSGATLVARSREDIGRCVRTSTGDGSGTEPAGLEAARQKLVVESSFVPDGRATERVADLIGEMTGEAQAASAVGGHRG